jgi:Acyl-CoA dehydrogenase, C-terminal domain
MAIDFTLTDGQKNNAEGHAIGAMSKVLCGELMFSSIFRAMQAMGVNALDKKHPVERFMRESLVFPLYDAGNIGMQMRKIWGVMLDEGFDPRAFMDSPANQVHQIHGGRIIAEPREFLSGWLSLYVVAKLFQSLSTRPEVMPNTSPVFFQHGVSATNRPIWMRTTLYRASNSFCSIVLDILFVPRRIFQSQIILCSRDL